MDENSETSFLKWFWNGFKGLKGLTGLYAESRSKKERDFGSFLLVTQVAWLLLPPTPIKFALHIFQMLLGSALLLHGHYLKSLEKAEEEREQEAYRKRRFKEVRKELREIAIKQIAEVNEISLEEAAEKVDESIPWMREAEEAEGRG